MSLGRRGVGYAAADGTEANETMDEGGGARGGWVDGALRVGIGSVNDLGFMICISRRALFVS